MKEQPKYEIIHLDEAVVAINKRPGLSVLPGRGRKDSLFELLKHDAQLAGKTPHVVHRIDADTSGIVLFALTPEAHKALSEQFRNRTVTKLYWAIVRGNPLHESGSVDLKIGIDPNDKKRMVIRGLDAKPSRTKWTLNQRFRGLSLLNMYPVTGRRHQIRVHLKSMGYPLLVDPLYGGSELKLSEFKKKYKMGKGQEERPLISRLTLHARAITFHHPAGGEEMTLEAQAPKDFRTTLTALGRWAR